MSKKYLPTLALLFLVPVVAAGQTTTEPQTPTEPQAPTVPEAPRGRTPRPYRGVFGGGPPADPNRTRQELTMTVTGTAGYDTWLSPTGGGGGQIDPAQRQQSGVVGVGDATLNYRRGRASRALAIEARGFTNAYSDINVSPLMGASVRADVFSVMGRRSRIQASHNTAYQPTLVLGAFGPLAIDLEPAALPDAGLSSGLVEQSSVASTSTINLNHEWSRRHNTAVSSSYSRVNYLDNLGFDSNARAANISYGWNATRRFTLLPSYRYDDSTYSQPTGISIPMTNHNFELAGTYTRRLSPSRQFVLTGGGGATYVSTVNSASLSPLTYTMPSGHASLQLDVLRSWAMSVNYRRAVNVVQGVSLESFATDTGGVQLDGLITRRAQLRLLAAYGNGRAGGGGSDARYDSLSGSAELRYALGRCCAVTTQYDYYNYHFQNVAFVSPAIPRTYDRQAVRVGFALWLPLYGRYVDGTTGGRR